MIEDTQALIGDTYGEPVIFFAEKDKIPKFWLGYHSLGERSVESTP